MLPNDKKALKLILALAAMDILMIYLKVNYGF